MSRFSILPLLGLFVFSHSIAAAPAKTAEMKDWTILIYAAGDEENVRLPTLGMLKRFERVPSLRADGNVRVVVEHDDAGKDKGYRYLLRYVANPSDKPGPDTAPLTEDEIHTQLQAFRSNAPKFSYGELDTGSAVTLKEFVRWGIEAYPARHYVLVLAGHSWGQQGMMQDFFVGDKELDKSTIMKNYEIRRAMEEIYNEFKAVNTATGKNLLPNGAFDVLLVDACVAGQLDVLLEFKDVFKYFVGSALETPYNSLPWTDILEPFIQEVNNHPGADPEYATGILEEKLLKPTVELYVKSHSRGGSLVKQEGMQDMVEMFAMRLAGLGHVAEALKTLVKSLPDEANDDWAQHKMPEVFLTSDSDSNADLLKLSEGFKQYFQRKKAPNRSPQWNRADKAAEELASSLGYGVDDPSLEKTVLTDDSAGGARVQIQIDESTPLRQLAACHSIKSFWMLNADILPPGMLPHFKDPKGNKETWMDFACNDLVHGNASSEGPVSGTPSADGGEDFPVDDVFGHKIKWDHGVSAIVREYREPHSKEPSRRTLILWIPNMENGPMHVETRLRLAGSGSIDIEYQDDHGKATRTEHQDVPAYFAVDDAKSLGLPDAPGKPGLYVAEAHNNGSHFKRGMGIFLDYNMKSGKDYQGGRLPIERVEKTPYSMTLEDYFASLSKKGTLQKDAIDGVDFYRAHRINDTLWPDFLVRGDSPDDDRDGKNGNANPPRWDEHRRVRRSK